jgi:hypothetical protein
MDWSKLRRIVTDETNGRSRILIDGEAAKLLAVEETGLSEIWQASLGNIQSGADSLKDEDVRLEPPHRALKVRWFTVAPEPPNADRKAMDDLAAQTFAAIGAAHARVDPSRHPFMHKTETLDVIVCVKGAVDLLLDDGEAKSLKPGDVVIQRATNHAWVNHGAETALLVAILVDARS